MEFFFENIQNRRIDSAKYEAIKAGSDAEHARSENADLARRVDKLALTCQALWEIVSARSNITQNELADKILEIDMRDGVKDGRMNAKIIKCSSCGHNTSATRPTCIICGVDVQSADAFGI